MKKIIALAVFGLAVSASAASIKWAIGSKLYGVDADGNVTQVYADGAGWYDDAKSGSFVLVYLGVNASATTANTISDNMVVSTATLSDLIVTSGKANAIGNASKLQTFNVDDVAGATYQVFFLNDGAYSDIYTDSSLSSVAKNTAVVSVDAAGAYSANTLYAAGSGSSASYVSVPEPSVALMGLLGIGMLLKRRKA